MLRCLVLMVLCLVAAVRTATAQNPYNLTHPVPRLATIFTDQAEDRPGVPIDVTVDRNGDVIVVPVAPVMTTNEEGDPTGRIGVELQVVTTRMGPLTAIKEGVLEVGRTLEESIH